MVLVVLRWVRKYQEMNEMMPPGSGGLLIDMHNDKLRNSVVSHSSLLPEIGPA